MPSNTDIFDRCVAVTFAIEGNGAVSTDQDDPGNWTGGAVGEGEFRGTKYGISAAAFPTLDIAGLTEDYAAGLAFAHYWQPAHCGLMPEALALLVFDAAFQHGLNEAVKFLQGALEIEADGVIGPVTQKALAENDLDYALFVLCVKFQNRRLLHMIAQESFNRIGAALVGRLNILSVKAGNIFNQMGDKT